MVIDVHHHYLPQELADNFERHVPDHVEVRRKDGIVTLSRRNDGYEYIVVDPALWCDPERQIRDMDAAGIDHAVLSVACYQDWMTMEAARLCNDGVAALVASHPDRFAGMISIPPDGGEPMVAEVHRATHELGLRGINLSTSYRGMYPDHPDFAPLFALAEELDHALYFHPSWHPPVLDNLESWNLERSIGKAFDLNLAAARLIFSGTMARHPRLRVAFAHLGGALPMTARRLFHGPRGWHATPDQDYPAQLKRVFLDTAPGIWQSPAEIEFACTVLGVDQVMLGSDYPLSNDPASIIRNSVRHVAKLPLEHGEKQKIFGDNAIRCFGLSCVHGARELSAG